MLTLQVMRIMDALWKYRDYDLCLSIYEVLPMGRNVRTKFNYVYRPKVSKAHCCTKHSRIIQAHSTLLTCVQMSHTAISGHPILVYI